MRSNSIEHVWINPPKYWAATKDMSSEEVERLLDEITALVENGDREALRHIEFVSLESPTKKIAGA